MLIEQPDTYGSRMSRPQSGNGGGGGRVIRRSPSLTRPATAIIRRRPNASAVTRQLSHTMPFMSCVESDDEEFEPPPADIAVPSPIRHSRPSSAPLLRRSCSSTHGTASDRAHLRYTVMPDPAIEELEIAEAKKQQRHNTQPQPRPRSKAATPFVSVGPVLSALQVIRAQSAHRRYGSNGIAACNSGRSTSPTRPSLSRAPSTSSSRPSLSRPGSAFVGPGSYDANPIMKHTPSFEFNREGALLEESDFRPHSHAGMRSTSLVGFGHSSSHSSLSTSAATDHVPTFFDLEHVAPKLVRKGSLRGASFGRNWAATAAGQTREERLRDALKDAFTRSGGPVPVARTSPIVSSNERRSIEHGVSISTYAIGSREQLPAPQSHHPSARSSVRPNWALLQTYVPPCVRGRVASFGPEHFVPTVDPETGYPLHSQAQLQILTKKAIEEAKAHAQAQAQADAQESKDDASDPNSGADVPPSTIVVTIPKNFVRRNRLNQAHETPESKLQRLQDRSRNRLVRMVKAQQYGERKREEMVARYLASVREKDLMLRAERRAALESAEELRKLQQGWLTALTLATSVRCWQSLHAAAIRAQIKRMAARRIWRWYKRRKDAFAEFARSIVKKKRPRSGAQPISTATAKRGSMEGGGSGLSPQLGAAISTASLHEEQTNTNSNVNSNTTSPVQRTPSLHRERTLGSLLAFRANEQAASLIIDFLLFATRGRYQKLKHALHAFRRAAILIQRWWRRHLLTLQWRLWTQVVHFLAYRDRLIAKHAEEDRRRNLEKRASILARNRNMDTMMIKSSPQRNSRPQSANVSRRSTAQRSPGRGTSNNPSQTPSSPTPAFDWGNSLRRASGGHSASSANMLPSSPLAHRSSQDAIHSNGDSGIMSPNSSSSGYYSRPSTATGKAASSTALKESEERQLLGKSSNPITRMAVRILTQFVPEAIAEGVADGAAGNMVSTSPYSPARVVLRKFPLPQRLPPSALPPDRTSTLVVWNLLMRLHREYFFLRLKSGRMRFRQWIKAWRLDSLRRELSQQSNLVQPLTKEERERIINMKDKEEQLKVTAALDNNSEHKDEMKGDEHSNSIYLERQKDLKREKDKRRDLIWHAKIRIDSDDDSSSSSSSSSDSDVDDDKDHRRSRRTASTSNLSSRRAQYQQPGSPASAGRRAILRPSSTTTLLSRLNPPSFFRLLLSDAECLSIHRAINLLLHSNSGAIDSRIWKDGLVQSVHLIWCRPQSSSSSSSMSGGGVDGSGSSTYSRISSTTSLASPDNIGMDSQPLFIGAKYHARKLQHDKEESRARMEREHESDQEHDHSSTHGDGNSLRPYSGPSHHLYGSGPSSSRSRDHTSIPTPRSRRSSHLYTTASSMPMSMRRSSQHRGGWATSDASLGRKSPVPPDSSRSRSRTRSPISRSSNGLLSPARRTTSPEAFRSPFSPASNSRPMSPFRGNHRQTL